MKKFLLKLLMGASLTASVFVFQACYGPAMPPPGEEDIPRNVTEFQEAAPDDPSAITEAETAEVGTEVEKETLD